MTTTLTAPQRKELKMLLLAKQDELHAQMVENEKNLVPPSTELGRIDLALKALDDGSYGLCDECGCNIPFERLKIEPQTQHCVACKSRWEEQQERAGR